MIKQLIENLAASKRDYVSRELFDLYYDASKIVEKFKDTIQKNNIDMKQAGADFQMFLVEELFLDRSRILINTLIPDEEGTKLLKK